MLVLKPIELKMLANVIRVASRPLTSSNIKFFTRLHPPDNNIIPAEFFDLNA